VTTFDQQTDHHLTREEQVGLERDGFVVRRNVFSHAEVADMVEHCEALVDRLVRGRESQRVQASGYVFDTDAEHLTVIKWEGDTDAVHGIEPFAHLSKPLEDWAYDPRLTQPMEALIGHAEPELFTEKLNLKRPQVGGANPLHQDYPYWVNVADDASQVATTIVFLDDATVENGCLWVIPGSHLQGKWTTRTDGDVFAHNEVDESSYPDAEPVPLELSEGSTVSFGAFLVHKSAPNLSNENRRALLYSYQPKGRKRQVDRLREWIASGGTR
jgi:phytanoyl-CoA hydroxylase